MTVVFKKKSVVLQKLNEAGDKFPDDGDNVSYAEFTPAVQFQGISYNRIHFKSIVFNASPQSNMSFMVVKGEYRGLCCEDPNDRVTSKIALKNVFDHLRRVLILETNNPIVSHQHIKSIKFLLEEVEINSSMEMVKEKRPGLDPESTTVIESNIVSPTTLITKSEHPMGI